jgi:methyltransferase-like protein/SAM-dependent methyltransferase
MTLPASLTYDQVPYPDLSHHNTHPGVLASLGRLMGMDPAPLERCRVLELGCAAGGNLFPMAETLPGSQFVGIDLSGVQIRQGRQILEELGLQNLRLLQMDILDVTPELGLFDYIIAHGVYAWVPDPVQEKILEICSTQLAPHGVAFISYNTYPGWHLINIPRDIMRFHSRYSRDPQEKVRQARASLALFAENMPEDRSPYAQFVNFYQAYLEGRAGSDRPKNDSALLHDDLDECNRPLYFYQFMEQAEAHGLQYLADASPDGGGNVGTRVLEELRQFSTSQVELEQSLDFLLNRTFRQTLLCRREVELNRRLRLEDVGKYYLSTFAGPVSEKPNLTMVTVEEFASACGARLSLDHPLSKAAMVCLAEVSPHALSLEELAAAARARLQESTDFPRTSVPEDPERDLKVLCANLLKAFSYSRNLVDLKAYRPSFARVPGSHPVAAAYIRRQALDGPEVTNLCHERIIVDELERFLLPLLDGSRDLQALVDLTLAGPVAQGSFTFETSQALDPQQIRQSLREEIEYKLTMLAKTAMFLDLEGSGD